MYHEAIAKKSLITDYNRNPTKCRLSAYLIETRK